MRVCVAAPELWVFGVLLPNENNARVGLCCSTRTVGVWGSVAE